MNSELQTDLQLGESGLGLTRLEQEFQRFHVEHPAVFRKFCELAFQLIERGHEHYSADAILHVIRFQTDLGWGRDGLKINNNHSPYYSRLFAKKHPQYKTFFSFRRAGS